MTQIARPISDVFNDEWTPSEVFAAVNGASPNTGSPASSPNNPQGKAFEVLLSSIQWPAPGVQKLTVQLSRVGSDEIWAMVEFLQGSELLGVQVVRNPPTGEQQTVEMSQEVGPPYWITDYTDLRVRVTASAGIPTSCCPNPIAPVLVATLSNKTEDAVHLPDSCQLTYSSNSWIYYGGRPSCLNEGQPNFQLAIECIEEGWVLPALASWYDQATKVSEQCDPFKLVFDVSLIETTGCDNGTFRVTVEEEE